ncbi:acyltransferase family protein [Daejeonella sp.]|uniref:acyltransferase family protein n=1 Tax=Daejeonella sp. TaxID=2805397 RepID=UPI00398319C2
MISGKRNYHEIDTIRFITISIIVWSHSLFPPWHLRKSNDLIEVIINSVVIQLGAISTVIFFIVSGILMHSKLQEYTFKKYFNERIPVVYAPWLFIVGLNVMLIMLHQILSKELVTTSISPILASIYVILNGLVIYGPYWFVLTYLIGMVVLIYFKQYSSNVFFGLLLFSITAFYAVNFHFSWIDTFHTKAVLAYTFFIWLGFQFHRHWEEIILQVEKIKWYVLIALMLVFFSIACYEGFKLSLDGVRDPYASNRFTNIIFSIIFFFFLLKIGPIRIINNLRPRKIVYGIYLVNSIVVLELTVLLKKYIESLYLVSIWTLLGLQIMFFTLTLILTYFIVNYLISSSLKWVIGSK